MIITAKYYNYVTLRESFNMSGIAGSFMHCPTYTLCMTLWRNEGTTNLTALKFGTVSKAESPLLTFNPGVSGGASSIFTDGPPFPPLQICPRPLPSPENPELNPNLHPNPSRRRWEGLTLVLLLDPDRDPHSHPGSFSISHPQPALLQP